MSVENINQKKTRPKGGIFQHLINPNEEYYYYYRSNHFQPLKPAFSFDPNKMSRQSLRKVKLTSKFEEFSTTRLASIQRQHHTQVQEGQNDSQIPSTPAAPVMPATPIPPATPETPVRVTKSAKMAKLATPVTPALESQPTTPVPYGNPLPKLTANGKVRGRPRKCWQQKAETTVKPISSTKEELLRLREENANLKIQLEQVTNDFEDLKRQSSYTGQTVPKVDYDDLKDQYERNIVKAKRNEWCAVCLNPSRYHCCWNTTYCSQKCQVSDWYSRHINTCERRKAAKNAAVS